MSQWHKDHVNILAQAIINEFKFLYEKIKSENNQIYAVCINLDEDIQTCYLAVATIDEEKNNANEHGYWQDKWASNEWKHAIGHGDVEDSISNLFLKKMSKHYDEDVHPLFEQGFDYEIERDKNYWLYTEGLRQAKTVLVAKYGHEVDAMLFYLSIFGDFIVER